MPRLNLMRFWKYLGIVVAALLVAGIVSIGVKIGDSKINTDEHQTALDPFYTAPDPLPSTKPGTVIRYEPMPDLGWNLQNANAFRTLSVSEAPDGTPRVTGGMVIFPNTPSSTPRPVVAYAHGTSGFGDACAPSRDTATPAAMPWVQTMINNGWVVTTTDYVGLGTAGDPYYLIGKSEATDVINSVRVARNIPGTDAGTDYVVFGHSQGGHSALSVGEFSKQIAPELTLKAVAATAPAAELGPLLSLQWNTLVGWAIGPDVLVSWPSVYKDIDPNSVLTEYGSKNYEQLAYMCLANAGIKGALETQLGNELFSKDPGSVPAFAAAIQDQTPKPLPASMPLFISTSIDDGIVLPQTSALLEQKFCAAGSNLQFEWLGQLATGSLAGPETHVNTPLAAWPMVVNWIQQRFANAPTTPNCGITPPVKPAAEVASSPAS